MSSPGASVTPLESGGGYQFGQGGRCGGRKAVLQHQYVCAEPPKADIGTQPCDVWFVPIADVCGAANTKINQSITLSAVASNWVGTVRPSIRAVRTLMDSSNFDDCTTGNSAGFSPFRMRPP